MNVLILGRNEINDEIAGRVRRRGLLPVVFENVAAVKSLRGECGDFIIKVGADEIHAAAVIVTEPPEKPVRDIGGGMHRSLFDGGAMKEIAESRTVNPVVIVLDYFNESPPSSTVKALEEAIAFASKKLNVALLFKFLRTAGMKSEELYSKTRNMGVTFIKYESIDISYETDINAFKINVSDGINDVLLNTEYIATDSGYGGGGRFAQLVKKLRLKADDAGYVNDDRFFTSPAKTSRRGIYFLNRDVCADRLNEAVCGFISEIVYGFKDGGQKRNHAVVDGEKCAFCYTCYRVCPHAAMEPDEADRVMKNNIGACEGCGTCASVCPGNAITMDMEEILWDFASGDDGRVKVFCCENSGDTALRNILPGLGETAALIDHETVPCGGRVGFEQLSGALKHYGKVMILACMDGACRHFDGNARACRQSERLSEMLENAGIDSRRVCHIKTSHAMAEVLKDDILEEML